MKRFYNDADAVVDELLAAEAHLRSVRLSTHASGMRIMVRADWCRNEQGADKVAVLSGGGAGHEPAHAGFVGEGMLTGAVSGSIFASPSVEAVLAGIREVCGTAGCLLIVKNYTGDRLNFGLAAERARLEGLKVEMVIVSDDIALDDVTQPRGIAGTVAVHKVAGYYATQGHSLSEVARLAEDAAGRLMSMGMALEGAALPGQTREERRPELGLGIHNETGAREVSPDNARDALNLVLSPLLEAMDARHGKRVPLIALLNNLGCCSSQEMSTLTFDLLDQLGPERLPMLIGPAPMMTSLDMHGFSITLLPFEDDLATALSAPSTAPGWPGIRHVTAPAWFEPDTRDEQRALYDNAPQNDAMTACLNKVLVAIGESREALDELDARTGDGDAGSSLKEGVDAIQKALRHQRLPADNWPALLAGIGELLARDMGGSSGVLLSILFTASAAELANNDDWAHALTQGANRMQTYGGAQPGDRTMMDALWPAIKALEQGKGLEGAARAAREGAEYTATLANAGAGRSSYVPADRLEGVIDPGAEAIARAFEALV
ncbi:dihydroxyacetone kinase subunit DhaK [Larsenimonas rhizosphaerae]|uniref:dihydroxyacetone kinase subunit DhaK n=1 Tax=Larsenimonas rhizosphaerae TaxID=2944682 RepID=UPI002033A022|nr:dihydroxyacetone kinase subunit DhaK [Larsenimonas rhizosphaerae]MCM2129756.1 dihydroxyacetone kinase subunit DhaK [Larsenimonas rhizosphaerae]